MTLFASNQALFSAYFQADFFGKCIFLGLFALSIICWVVLVYKTLQVRKAKKLAFAFEKVFNKNKEQLLNMSVKQSHPFAEVFVALKQKTLEILNKNHFFAEDKETIYLTRSDLDLVESHVLTTISSESKRLEKNLFVLSTIYSLAPFLGLLGTVWGILVTFSELQTGGSATSNTAMLGGLSTALATTVLGLLIAIPALVSYNWLRNTFKYLSSDMEDFLYKLLSTLELQYRKPL
ncbi:MAG: Biopolymer transport protein ExbB [Chlamydiae bacterium]|nr:Biopolymer transport protein ExbB [Chlamydiota bacterium]